MFKFLAAFIAVVVLLVAAGEASAVGRTVVRRGVFGRTVVVQRGFNSGVVVNRGFNNRGFNNRGFVSPGFHSRGFNNGFYGGNVVVDQFGRTIIIR
jgi:hypothetical protein